MTPSTWSVLDGARIAVGDCRSVLAEVPDASVDAVVTDPPYGLSKAPDVAEVLGHWLTGDDYHHTGSGFMGKSWDSFVPGPAVWRECLRVLKPGGHLLCFAGTRTFDLMGISLRLAGFDIRDTIEWLHGEGFPKSTNVSKSIDKARGPAPGDAAKQWEGWGTALKPAHEPIIMARKPLAGTVAANVLALGTGAINIAASRVGLDRVGGRFPANLIFSHDQNCDDVCIKGCPVRTLDEQSGIRPGFAGGGTKGAGFRRRYVGDETVPNTDLPAQTYGDTGGASRFFYCAKTSKAERHAGLPAGSANSHPTVKPVALMRYLVDMVTQPGGVVLDPFMGSGSTGVAGVAGRFQFVGIDADAGYVEIARHRLVHAARTLGSQLPLVG